MSTPETLEPNLPVQIQRASKKTPPVGMPETKRIILEESDDIPPGGLFIGLNGRGYKLQPGMEADVPLGVVEVLDHAIMSAPVVDPQTRRVTGHRDRMRYPYRVVTAAKTKAV